MTGSANGFAHLKGAALSDIGRKRKNNEDSFGAFPAHGVWCVADGMGGGDDGEVASAAVVKSVDAYLSDLPTVDAGAYAGSQIAKGVIAAVEEASGWVFRRTKKKGLKGCGSTFVGIVFDATAPGAALALHVGDSRLYRLRGKELKQITKDHSVAEMMGAKDEKDLNPMFRGMILRAVGIESSVEVEQTPLAVNEGDVILICSDGLSRMVPDKRIGEIIREGGDNVEATAKRLVAAANEAGGIDNVTVALVKVGALPAPLPAVGRALNDDVSSSSSLTLQTLEREYGTARRWLSHRGLLIAVTVCAVVAFGWAVSLSFFREKPRTLSASSIEAISTAESIQNAVATNEVAGSTETEVATNAPAVTVEPMTNAVPAVTVVPVTNAMPAVTVEPVTNAAPAANEDPERDAVEEELRAERERRKRVEDAAAGQERDRRQVAQALAQTHDRSFDVFARFVDAIFGKGACDKAKSLCRQLQARAQDADVSMYAGDFTSEVAELARKLMEKCEQKKLRKDESVMELRARCKAFVDKDLGTLEAQRKCLELIEFVAERREQGNGRK